MDSSRPGRPAEEGWGAQVAVRVLHVTNHLTDAGGAEVSLIQLLPHLQAAGVDNVVLPLTRFEPTARAGALRESGVCVLEGGDGRLPSYVASVRRAIRSAAPDLVHSSIWDADLASRLAALGTGVPVIAGLVNAQYSSEAYGRAKSRFRLRAYQGLDGLLARHATTAFHALTEHVADEGVRALGIRRESVTVIPRGRDRSLLGEPGGPRSASVRRCLGIPEDAPVVVNLARQQPQKALPLLVRAFAQVAARHPAAVLVQAGRGGLETAAIRDEISAHNLDERVLLLGRRDDTADLLAMADLFAFSSLWEGQGGAVLEAMAMGLPVVAFDVPAVRESLAGAGVLVPVGDHNALGVAMGELFDDEHRRRTLGGAARRRFDEVFEIAAVAGRMAAFYGEVHRASSAGPSPSTVTT